MGLNLLHIPLSALEVEDISLSTGGDLEAFKTAVSDKAEKEKFKIGQEIIDVVKKVIDDKINGVDLSTGIANKDVTTMSSAPSFVGNYQQPDTNRFATTVRLSDYNEYFNLLYNAFNIETLVEIRYKAVLNDDDLHGVPPFECSYRESEDSSMKYVNIALNIHEGDLGQIERGIDFIVNEIHDNFYHIFADVSEDHNYELNTVTQNLFKLILKKTTGKDEPSEVDSEDAVQEAYYMTLVVNASKFYQARKVYEQILGMQVEPQNILNTKKTLYQATL